MDGTFLCIFWSKSKSITALMWKIVKMSIADWLPYPHPLYINIGFRLSEKFGGWLSSTQTPAQRLKHGFSVFSSHEIASGLVSFEMIFEALLFKLSRLMFHLLNSKILRIPGFNLAMDHWQWYPCWSYKGTSNKNDKSWTYRPA